MLCSFILSVYEDFILPMLSIFCLTIRNVAKMEDAKVEIDDGKDENVVPDTIYQ